jgi:hypothetical protein
MSTGTDPATLGQPVGGPLPLATADPEPEPEVMSWLRPV